MRSIHRYPLFPPQSSIALPAGAEVFAAAWWKENICIWAVVDPIRATVPREFVIHSTGIPFPYNETKRYKFIGQAFMPEEGLVFHVFETF